MSNPIGAPGTTADPDTTAKEEWNARVHRVRIALDLYERLATLVGEASPQFWFVYGQLWYHLSRLGVELGDVQGARDVRLP